MLQRVKNNYTKQEITSSNHSLDCRLAKVHYCELILTGAFPCIISGFPHWIKHKTCPDNKALSPDSSVGKCRRPRFYSWVGKIPWRRERLPTPAFWPGEIHGLYSPWGCKELETTEWLSLKSWAEILSACHLLLKMLMNRGVVGSHFCLSLLVE